MPFEPRDATTAREIPWWRVYLAAIIFTAPAGGLVLLLSGSVVRSAVLSVMFFIMWLALFGGTYLYRLKRDGHVAFPAASWVDRGQEP